MHTDHSACIRGTIDPCDPRFRLSQSVGGVHSCTLPVGEAPAATSSHVTPPSRPGSQSVSADDANSQPRMHTDRSAGIRGTIDPCDPRFRFSLIFWEVAWLLLSLACGRGSHDWFHRTPYGDRDRENKGGSADDTNDQPRMYTDRSACIRGTIDPRDPRFRFGSTWGERPEVSRIYTCGCSSTPASRAARRSRGRAGCAALGHSPCRPSSDPSGSPPSRRRLSTPGTR